MSAPVPAYRQILLTEFRRLCGRNPSYSLRSFARRLGLSPSRVSEVLAGKQGLSSRSAEQIAERLGYSPPQKEHFCDLVDSIHSRSPARRQQASSRLRAREEEQRFVEHDEANFEKIGTWVHLAILELTEVTDFRSEVAWIAGKLGINEQDTAIAVDRLVRAGLLEWQDRKLVCRTPFSEWRGTRDATRKAIRAFHRGVIERAAASIEGLPVDLRSTEAIIFSFDSSKQHEAQAELTRFRQRFCRKFGAGQDKDTVSCLSLQFFSMLKPDGERSGS